MTRAFLLTLVLLAPVHAATVSEPLTGITLSVSQQGTYLISVQDPAWTFAGVIGSTLTNVHLDAGKDRIGAYDEIAFQFLMNAPRQGSIRVYQQKPIVLFTLKLLETGANTAPFPVLSTYPRGLHHLTYYGWDYSFNQSTTDGPLVEFDDDAHAFIVSAASDFLQTTTSIDHSQNIATGIDPSIGTLPAQFTHQTILVVEKGINQAFETWGHALTDLGGKIRPSNNADVTLSHLGYWTDNGATYYYHYEPELGYEGTLRAIHDEFLSKGVPLGYLQLDSWFYPKGPQAGWDERNGGIYEYLASPDLFPNGLKAFQGQLRIPVVTHARWIDASSPYRRDYTVSGNVAIDSRYWDTVMSYLQDAGVTTYEQDWLSAFAHTNFNLSDPNAFLDDMAQAASRYGLTMQYCMPRARDYLQSSRYNNLTTMRTSGDRFDRSHWDQFLYGSRLASALGVWPWADVFMSSELNNLLLATLSAGVVGVGDSIGSVNAANLLRAVRNDGVIVKPDVPLVPLDQSLVNDAQQADAPMVAATYTDFGGIRVGYIVAYPRGTDTTVSFRPELLGLSGPAYVYDYFANIGKIVNAGEAFTTSISGDLTYYIVTPIGKSAIGLLGDNGQLVSLGRQRISQVTDDGVLEFTVAFAPGETTRVIHGYSRSQPIITVRSGEAGALAYNPVTQRFHVSVSGDAGGSAVIDLVSSNVGSVGLQDR